MWCSINVDVVVPLSFCICGVSVNVDEWLNQAQIDSLTADENGLHRTPSQISLRTESSGGVCDFFFFFIKLLAVINRQQ